MADEEFGALLANLAKKDIDVKILLPLWNEIWGSESLTIKKLRYSNIKNLLNAGAKIKFICSSDLKDQISDDDTDNDFHFIITD